LVDEASAIPFTASAPKAAPLFDHLVDADEQRWRCRGFGLDTHTLSAYDFSGAAAFSA
jgi:hypothetical protein